MKRRFKHLSIEERHIIYEGKRLGQSMAMIAESVGRSKSTVSSELRRNSRCGNYIPHVAHEQSIKRRHTSGLSKIDRDPVIRGLIYNHLRYDCWSPDVIAGRLKKEGVALISAETIYHWIYHSAWAIEHKVYQYLPTRRPKRLPRIARKKRPLIPNRTPIHERDPIAATKQEIGHFEGDLTFHTGNRSHNIGSLVDKACQKVFLCLNRSKRAKTVASGFIKRMKEIPFGWRKTMVLDNGLEFRRHMEFRLAGFDTYFCDPYSPNQKPLVEKMNSMIHRILPKNIDIKSISSNQIQKVENILNNMPRRILGFKTPNEVWEENMQNVLF